MKITTHSVQILLKCSFDAEQRRVWAGSSPWQGAASIPGDAPGSHQALLPSAPTPAPHLASRGSPPASQVVVVHIPADVPEGHIEDECDGKEEQSHKDSFGYGRHWSLHLPGRSLSILGAKLAGSPKSAGPCPRSKLAGSLKAGSTCAAPQSHLQARVCPAPSWAAAALPPVLSCSGCLCCSPRDRRRFASRENPSTRVLSQAGPPAPEGCCSSLGKRRGVLVSVFRSMLFPDSEPEGQSLG